MPRSTRLQGRKKGIWSDAQASFDHSTVGNKSCHLTTSHISSSVGMCNSAGKVHNCFGIVTGFRFRQQWFNGIWASELRKRVILPFYPPCLPPYTKQLIGKYHVRGD